MDRDLKSKSVESVKFEDQKTIAMDLMKNFSRDAKGFPKRVSGKLEELADYSIFDLAAWTNWKSQYVKSVKQLDLVYMSETGLRFLLYAAFQQIKCSKLKTFTNTPCEEKYQYFLRHKLFPEIAFKTGASYDSWMYYDAVKNYTLRLGAHFIDGVDSNAKLRRMTYEEAEDLNKHYKKQQVSLRIRNHYEEYVLE